MTPRALAMAILEREPKEKDIASIVIVFDKIQNFRPYPELYAKYKIRINYVDGDVVEMGKLELIGEVFK